MKKGLKKRIDRISEVAHVGSRIPEFFPEAESKIRQHGSASTAAIDGSFAVRVWGLPSHVH